MSNLIPLPNRRAADRVTKLPAHSSLISRNIVIARRRTSVRLEPEMWDGLRDIARREGASLHDLCTSVALEKARETSLTAAIRVFIMRYFRVAATEEGHRGAGHGGGWPTGLAGPGATAFAPQQTHAMLTQSSFS